MKLTGRISQRPRVVLVTLVLVFAAVVAGVLVASGGDEGEAERQLFLIGFHESLDFALVEEYGGEIWIPYAFVSAVNAWMTPEAAEALAEHEAVKCVDQRQLFFIWFEESVDRSLVEEYIPLMKEYMSLVEEYGGEIWLWDSFRSTAVNAWMTPEAAEALAEHEAVKCVDQRWLFLISFHESIDAALVEEYGGEIWIMYPLASRINAWMTPEAAEALAEHEAVEYVDRRQLFGIMFEEAVDPALVEQYGGEVFQQMSMLPAVYAFMMPEAAEALAKEPAVRYVEPDWPVYPAEDQGI